MSRWVRSFGELRIRSLGCSKVASRLICSTVSSHSWSCWRSCYEDIRLGSPIDGNRVGAGRSTGISRLGEPVPSVATEQVRPEHSAAVPWDPKVIPQRGGDSSERLAAIPARAVRGLWRHGDSRCRQPFGCNALTHHARRGCDCTGRTSCDCACVPIFGGHGHWNCLWYARCTPRNDDRIPRGARTAGGDLCRFPNQRHYGVADYCRTPLGSELRSKSESRLYGSRIHDGAASRKCAYSG